MPKIVMIRKKVNYLEDASSVYHKQAYYVFGGSSSEKSYMTEIGRLDEVKRTWSFAGHLNEGRSSHGVIFDGSRFLVIGGFYRNTKKKSYTNEICEPTGESVICTGYEEQFAGSLYNPDLALVHDGYGDDC